MIAPFWDYVDITRFGNIYYRQTSNATLLRRARDQLQELFPSSGNFTPSTLFIATWDRVAEFTGYRNDPTSQVVFDHTTMLFELIHVLLLAYADELFVSSLPVWYHNHYIVSLQTNTFQVVIAANEKETFVFFIYGDIQWGYGAFIGFSAAFGARSFMVPGALTAQSRNVDNGSNVNVTGLYIYRINSCSVFGPNDGEKLLIGTAFHY